MPATECQLQFGCELLSKIVCKRTQKFFFKFQDSSETLGAVALVLYHLPLSICSFAF